ncbi:MAG TPA: prepilin-type N-terminal cleavage/methylation domain-containing protein [Candidatus Paceibacterota bacterium]|nr:prepilin-type N-terminal cleavage/methylation domain-containing protein [Candidatus Paceibacterota bacterium]
MSRASDRRDGGFSLAELIVYVALVAILLGVIVSTALSMGAVYRRSRTYLDINSAAVTAFSRFSRDIRRASAIDLNDSVLAATPGRLTLLMKRSDDTNDSVSYYVSDSKVKVDENGAYAGDVTQGDVAVFNLTFRKFASASSTAIRIEMTMAPAASTSVPALNFYGTYVLRGSYVR